MFFFGRNSIVNAGTELRNARIIAQNALRMTIGIDCIASRTCTHVFGLVVFAKGYINLAKKKRISEKKNVWYFTRETSRYVGQCVMSRKNGEICHENP